MRPFITVMGAGLLVLSYVTVSDARPYAKRTSPTQSGAGYYSPDYDSTRDRDNSCFSRSTGLPTEYACGANGG